MARPAYSEASFQEAVARIRSGQHDHSLDVPRPGFDPKLASEFQTEEIHGRKIEDYKAVLGYWGFRFIPPERLPFYPNGQPHTEGEWRCPSLRMAFTDTDVLRYKSAEDFDAWLRNFLLRKRAAKAGIIIAR